MLVVVDANELFSAIISPSGKTAELFLSDKIEIISPIFILKELDKYKSLLLDKSKIKERDFSLLIALLFSRIKFFETDEYKEFFPKAQEICPDKNDTEYFALALKLNCPIWTNDKKLKEQNKIKIYSTEELIEAFNS